MKSTTTRLDSGPLADVDLVALGAASGWLWRSHDLCLAGVGTAISLPVDRPNGGAETTAALGALAGPNELPGVPGTGPIALGALPFAPDRPGALEVPLVLLGTDGEQRWLTTFGPTESEVEAMVDDLFGGTESAFTGAVRLRSTMLAREWRDTVGRVRDRIAAGEVRKAVLARELAVSADGPIDSAALVHGMATRFPTAVAFAVDGFVGASPERLVSREGRIVRAQPLAGTAARSDDPSVDAERIAALRASAKDQFEHRITIDWLLSELLPFCSYVDAEPEPSVLTMANVHHLATTVEGVLSEPAASVLDLVGAIHPTPALGGDPQDAALGVIESSEGFDRDRYGGPVGWIDAAGNGHFVVGIRSAQITGATARVWAGVGVVEQSDPEAELAETQAKFAAVLGSLLG